MYSSSIEHLLVTACKLADYDSALRLVNTGANVNGTNEIGVSVLMFAVMRGDIRIVQLLLESGADADHTDDTGKTALWLAEGFKHEEIATLLRHWKVPQQSNG